MEEGVLTEALRAWAQITHVNQDGVDWDYLVIG